MSPIIFIVLAFMAGVLTGHYVAPEDRVVLVLLAVSLAGIAAGLRWRRRFLPILLTLSVWFALGTLSYQVRYYRCAGNDIVRYSADEPVLVRLRVEVLEDAQWVDSSSPWPSDPSMYLSVRVTAIHTRQGWVDCRGMLRVMVRRPSRAIVRGERLETLGILSRYRGPQNPGQFNWQRYNRFQNRLCRLTVDDGRALRSLKPSSLASPGLLRSVRRSLSTVLSSEDFSAESSSLLKAMVLGERNATFRRLNEAFQTTGLFHFLCVSGLHLGILAGFIWLVALLVGLPRRASALLVMTAVISYALLVPGRSPIIRATVVVCILCLGEISGSHTKRLHTLALAALVILLWRPAEIFNIGFQLSFIIVAALILLCPRLAQMISGARISDWTKDPGTHPHPRTRQLGRWLRLWFVRLSSTCLIAWFVSVPLIVYYFGWFNPWAPVYSVLMAPLAVTTIVSGYITVLLGPVFPLLLNSLQAVSLGLANLFFRAAAALAEIPGVIRHLPAPPVILRVAFYVVLILVALRPRLRQRYPSAVPGRAWTIVPLLALLAVYLWCAGPSKPADTLAFHLLAVGNGQASILELPNGATIVCDAGNMSGSDLASRTIMPFLRTRGLRKLDAMMISHSNWDHYSAAVELLQETNIPTLMVSSCFEDESQREKPSGLFSAVASKNTIGKSVRLTNTGAAQIEILWPPLGTKSVPTLTSNDSSLVIRISYAGRRILLTGDISSAAQGLLLANGTDLKADVLIWPHHGAIVSTTQAFFDAVDPKVILVSCDAKRSRNVRRTDNNRLVAGRQCHTTAQSGALTVLLSTKGVEVIPFIRAE